MSPWAIVAAAYGAVLLGAAMLLPIPRRFVTVWACVAYLLLALGAGAMPRTMWVSLALPAALLLGGYWLSGFFFHAPQQWLEMRLLALDRRVFRATALDSVLERAPRWALEVLEGSYAAISVVIAGGAIVAALKGLPALEYFWTLVLAAELGCYIWLPWLRSRPPRALEAPGVIARRGPTLRKLNAVVLDRGSVHANTLPSGHVAGAVAAALGALPVNEAVALGLLTAAAAIAVAATAGRYHYAVDCAAGALVAVFVWSLV